MPLLNPYPTMVPVTGGQTLMEHVGRLSTGNTDVSLAHMTVSGAWVESWRRAEHEEVVLVLKGVLTIEHDAGMMQAHAGQSVVVPPGRRLRHSCGPTGA